MLCSHSTQRGMHHGRTNRASDGTKCVSGMLIHVPKQLTTQLDILAERQTVIWNYVLAFCRLKLELTLTSWSCNGMHNCWRWQHALRNQSHMYKESWADHWKVCGFAAIWYFTIVVEVLLYAATTVTYMWSAMQPVLWQSCQAWGYALEYCASHKRKVKSTSCNTPEVTHKESKDRDPEFWKGIMTPSMQSSDDFWQQQMRTHMLPVHCPQHQTGKWRSHITYYYWSDSQQE